MLVNQILDRSGPATEEERLLLEVFTADSESIATTIKKLQQCGMKTHLYFVQKKKSSFSSSGTYCISLAFSLPWQCSLFTCL